MTAPDGSSATNYTYNINQTTITDAANKTKTQTVDALGNLFNVQEPDTAHNFTNSTTYSYNVLNQLTLVTMVTAGGTQTRTFNYDTNTGRLNSATTPESGTVHYYYNTDGTMQYEDDAKQQKTTYAYDAYGRVTQVQRYLAGTNQPDSCQTVTYTYDTATVQGVVIAANGSGRLTGMQWKDRTCQYAFAENYAYGPGGKVYVKQVTATNSAFPGATPVNLNGWFTHNAEGRLDIVQAPGASPYFSDLDALGRPVDLYTGSSQSPQWLVQGVTYNAAGKLTAMTYNNTFTETRQYNANLQLTRQTAVPGTGQGVDLSYNFPVPSANNGRVQSIKDNLSGQTVNYQYDSLNRLSQITTSDAAWGMTFGYDGFGNLTQETPTQGVAPTLSLTVDPATNRILSSQYAYDANGNQTQGPGGAAYGYDAANRMVTTTGGPTWTYDPRNRRMFDGTYVYYYGLNGELLAKYSLTWSSNGSAGTLQGQANVFFNGRPLWLSGHGWVMTDRLGSVRANGNSERFNYYPLGDETGSGTANGRVKYGTYVRDGALDYADQRYYAVGKGRFMTSDPFSGSTNLGDPQSLNRYAYGLADPVNHADPTGLCTIDGVIYPDGQAPCPDVTSVNVNGGPSVIVSSVSVSGGDNDSVDFGISTFSRPRTDLLQLDLTGSDQATAKIAASFMDSCLKVVDTNLSSMRSPFIAKNLQSIGKSMITSSATGAIFGGIGGSAVGILGTPVGSAAAGILGGSVGLVNGLAGGLMTGLIYLFSWGLPEYENTVLNPAQTQGISECQAGADQISREKGNQ